MVKRPRRGKGKQALLGNHQRCWIWGKHVVRETIRAGRWPILRLALGTTLPAEEFDWVQEQAAEQEIPLTVEPAEALSRRCRSTDHQGYLAQMPPFPYDDVETVLNQRPSSPLYAVLDSIQDPYNFGAILRSADALAVDAVFVRSHHQSAVTSLVARSSAGAVNHVPIARAANLLDLAKRLRELHVQLVAATEKATTRLAGCDFRSPVAIVIGNEGHGIQHELLDLCDRYVSIPQSGSVESLNAAVSAGIVFYEARRQRMETEDG